MSTSQRKERSLKCTAAPTENGWFLLVDASVTQAMKRKVARAKVRDAEPNRAIML